MLDFSINIMNASRPVYISKTSETTGTRSKRSGKKELVKKR